MTSLINLTPHVVVIDTADGQIQLEPGSKPARVQMSSTTLAPVIVDGMSVPLVNERVTSAAALPEPAPDTLYVVPRLVAEHSPHRTDLVVPTQLVRSAGGAVGAARALARVGVSRLEAGRTGFEVAEGTLVVLCGSNPLPVLLAITTRRPPAVVLVHTRETRPHMKRLVAALERLDEPIAHRAIELADAGSGLAVREQLAPLGARWELDYTGGTKAMAAHARLALESVRIDADRVASYIDHSRNVLRFDDGRRVALRTATLTLQSLAAMHGGLLSADMGRDRPDADWLRSFGASVVREMGRATTPQARKTAYLARAAQLKALPASPSWKAKLSAVPGTWLEWLVEDRVMAALGSRPRSSREVMVGSRFRPERAADTAEIDVLVRVGWRVTLLSCDTSLSEKRWTANHKQKAIESVARARQIGGDAAGAAFVTLLESDGVEAVSRHLPPTELNAPSKVFGRHDLVRWLDGDLGDLTEWCTT